MNIYQVSEQYLLALNELLSIEDLPDEVVRDTIESLQGGMEEKARNVAAYIQNIEAEALAIRDAEVRMVVRRKNLDCKAEKLRECLTAGLQKCGIFEVKCPEFNIRVKLNRAGVAIDDIDKIPGMFMTEKKTFTANKILIKASIDSGTPVPGARLERKTSLEIK